MKEFQNIFLELSPDLKKIDEIILQFSVGKSSLISEVSSHLISSGGKRIRPILLILAAKLCGSKSDDDYLNLAAAVELIHSATLLHDDVVDESQIRRGKKTSNSIWGNKPSILVGDYLFSIAFQLMVKSQNLSVLDLLAKASSIMADGEVMQLENSSNIALSQEKYLEIIFGKTAVLFAAACESGALINNRPEPENRALHEFGKNLGIIFQIVDDILDYSSQEVALGKEIGNDFFESKVTLPAILTYQKSNPADKKFIVEIFEKNFLTQNKDQNDFADFLKLIKKHEGFESSKKLALRHQKLAFKNLQIFVDSPAKKHLTTVLQYSLSRIF
jgi:octaprenyl-diphosphate synthase